VDLARIEPATSWLHFFPLWGRKVRMPWKECSVMDETLQFVARWLAGEAMAELCREFGISRRTGPRLYSNSAVS
jgi:hypothetical protein